MPKYSCTFPWVTLIFFHKFIIVMRQTLWPWKDICETIWDYPRVMSQASVDHWSSCLQLMDIMGWFRVQNLPNLWPALNRTAMHSLVSLKYPYVYSHIEVPRPSCSWWYTSCIVLALMFQLALKVFPWGALLHAHLCQFVDMLLGCQFFYIPSLVSFDGLFGHLTFLFNCSWVCILFVRVSYLFITIKTCSYLDSKLSIFDQNN